MKEKLLELIIGKQDEIIKMYQFPEKEKGYIGIVENTKKWIKLSNEITELKSQLQDHVTTRDLEKIDQAEEERENEPSYSKGQSSKLAEELSKPVPYTPVEIDRVIDNMKNLIPGISEKTIKLLCTEIFKMSRRMAISLKEAVTKITKIVNL